MAQEHTHLVDDEVYDYFRGQILDGHLLVGGKIEEPKAVKHNSARKIIVLYVEDPEGKTHVYKYNYKKFERMIAQEKRKAGIR